MVGHRTVAANLAIHNDIASLHARGRHALHVPTASLGLLARQTTTASHGRSAWVRLCLARLTLAEEPSTHGLAIRTTVGMVWHRTVAASLTILDDVAGLDAHGMAIRTAVGMVGHRTVAASLAIRNDIAGLHATLAEEPSTDGDAIGTTGGMVWHHTIAASLTILDDVADRDALGMAIRAAVGMVGLRTVAASLAIRNDITNLHARGRHALHVPTASLGLLARQTPTTSDGRSAQVRLCLARLTLAEEPSTHGLAIRTTF